MPHGSRKGYLDAGNPFLAHARQKKCEENDRGNGEGPERNRNTEKRANTGGAGKRNHRGKEYRKDANFRCEKR
jgi:hypothetical protein